MIACICNKTKIKECAELQGYNGLTNAEVEKSRSENGSNALTQLKKDSLFKQLLDGFKDPMLLILIVSFFIQLTLVFFGRGEWFEAVGIAVAILVANVVGVMSENKQEGKAALLRAEALARERVKVYREGKLIEIGINDVVVRDVIFLQAGDKIPADGILLDGKIKVDQAALNGESDEAKKEPLNGGELGNTKETLNPYYVFRATVVTQGECVMEAKVVGDNTEYGKLALEMQEDTRETPLKVKLGQLADKISLFGKVGAAIIFMSYLFQNLILSGNVPTNGVGWIGLLTDALALAVVIVVMAVPEGLPMMISLVLSMNMGKMMKDNVLVHKLNGIETAGGLNILFSDKTGTITQGKLSVVEMVTGSVDKFTDIGKVTPSYANDILYGIGLNNSASSSDGKVIGGNSTDRALMSYIVSLGMDKKLDNTHTKKFNPFDSAKKYSSITVDDSGVKTYIKGAPERIISRCTHYINTKGEVVEFGDSEQAVLMGYMDEQASKQMRMLGVAVRNGDTDEGDDLTLVCIISIRDEVRAEARQAIAEVKKAGVQVVMVTGDRKETAIAIAKDAGLLVEDTDIAMTSAELNEKSDEEIKGLLPNLRVVARALPTDKSRLVRLAQELDLVVGMTGDGVNDSPALKKADVGFAMGSGTEVAKEAGDITILDDNFLSIEKAILYGRTIFKNIRKFLIFQLTVNVSTVLLCFLAPLLGISQPLSIVSILYINLVMDTLAALAFGNEPALQRYMEEKPIKRSESILSKQMIAQIGSIGAYIVAVSLIILLAPSYVWNLFAPGVALEAITVTYKESAMLAFMMLTVILNGFYARTDNLNVFEHIEENKMFLAVMAVVLVMLVVLITLLGSAAALCPISLVTWLFMGLLAFGSVIIDIIRKLLVK